MAFDLTDTTTGQIQEALRRARHSMGSPAMGMVLTLIIATDEGAQYDAVRAASQAAREHPSRVIAVIGRSSTADSRLDAEVRVGGETGPGETVILRTYGELGAHGDSVIAPLLVPDAPVVIWWPAGGPEQPGADSLGALAQRRVTDAAGNDDPLRALAARAASYQPGDTDLAWTRLTPWRSLLAAAFDQPAPAVTEGSVSGEQRNPSVDLLAAWLSNRLGIPISRKVSPGPGITDVTLTTAAGQIVVDRPDGRVATLVRLGGPARPVALQRRDTAELLAEELRRLDPDELYAETVTRLADDLARSSADHAVAAPAGPASA